MMGYDYVIKRNAVLVKNIKNAPREYEYMLPCGHKNGVIPSIWPFDTMICTTCKARTKVIMKMAQKQTSIGGKR